MSLTPEAVARLQLAHCDMLLALRKIGNSIDDPTHRHTLPFLLRRAREAHEQMLGVVAEFAPEGIGAMARGLDSTEDLHASEIATLAIERAAT